MKAPIYWLKDYVDINVDINELAHLLTVSGSKVEAIEDLGKSIEKVVVGKIISMDEHPDADKLKITQVDVGKEVVQIVTGAPNVNVGDYIPVALVGAQLPGGALKKAKLRGVESYGMMCSIDELNLTHDYLPDAPKDGVYIFSNEPELGMDVKEVLGLKPVIEFEITSNRPDCFSMLGLARETAITLNTDFKRPEIIVKEKGKGNASDFVSVSIMDSELSSRYAARTVTDVKIEPSPEWMQRRLAAAGMRPINNIVDITNYVMLEMGQPMHAFDLKCVDGENIIVRSAQQGESITTLDGQERQLDSSMLVIADENKAVAIAGVMGGENSEITSETKMILLESATFNGASVRLTSKKIGIRSEASTRFEKGLDSENVIPALNRCAQLIEQLGAGKVTPGIVDCYPAKPEPVKVQLNDLEINHLLGTNIEKEWMIKLFEKLEFVVERDSMMLTVPSFRSDVRVIADLAEEVARFYDYNNIKPTLLSGGTSTIGRKTHSQKMESLIAQQMLSLGLYETYSFSFTSPKVWDRMRLPKEHALRDAVVITNPLGEDFSIMRTTTIPEMLGVIKTNYNRKVEEGGFFEISYVYNPIKDQFLPEERKVLTIGLYGDTDFYYLKGIVEQLFVQININNADFSPEKNNPSYHPGRCARVSIGNTDIGYIGEIHPEVASNFECPNRTYIAVLDIDPMIENSNMEKEYSGLPKYPAIGRDIALIVNEGVLVKDINAVILQRGGKILEQVKLFDVYKGEQVPEGMKSVAYNLTFRSRDRTLVDEEVSKAMGNILHELKTRLNATLRE
ncbi:MAG TPA: phenylalanine--tRNA ligase subunit beta [Thermoclostridium sp.]|nr:phenylalanine--tRNA ligase subunit beta [Thermoclostridium sp.]